MNPEVWVASGHVSSFADPLIDCKKCKSRHRADKLIEEFTDGKETGDGWDNKKLEDFISHMPESITKRQKEELFKTINSAIENQKDVKITISEDYTILNAEIINGDTITKQTIDIKKMMPKKKNKFIEWLNN